jgi:hypothetical protein
MTFIFGKNLEGSHIVADKNLDRKQDVGTASARSLAIPGVEPRPNRDYRRRKRG